MNQNERIQKNFTDVMVKYMENKTPVRLIMRNGFQTKGTITAVYRDGLQFRDSINGHANEVPIGALSTIVI